jgi:hypothetical protein
MTLIRPASPTRRIHIVLVPGFAGFDALGQLEYYADLTPLFRQWRGRARRRRPAVLHYFDNVPTASVATRAGRLQRYLAKRVARGEFQAGDRLALVGHSTGGLDIRCLLRQLASSPRRQTRVDAERRSAVGIVGDDLLAFVDRVVFLSVPHRGTNIADWVAGYRIGRRLLLRQLRTSASAAHVPVLRLLQDWVTGSAAWLAGSDVLLAVQDALREVEADDAGTDAGRVLDAQEAAADLSLWLQYMATDFAVIHDLAVRPPQGRPPSPAQFSNAERERELAAWRAHGLTVRSYATIARPPIRPPDGPLDTWNPLAPWTYADRAPEAPDDALYLACYRACAGGPFVPHEGAASVRVGYLRPSHRTRLAAWGVGDRFNAWENDGIVNTASMVWPGSGETFLVPGDHMDVVGHYRRAAASGGSARRFHTYDLLASRSEFDAETFREVWEDVFAFCCD